MTLPEASPPDVVLAKQKDDHYREQLVEEVAGATDAVLGAHTAIVLRPELRLLAESLLMGATMVRGRQTPGEEYCDLLLVDESSRRMGETFRHRLPLFTLVVGVPYLLRRYQAGGWAQLKTVFSPLSAHQRAAQLRKSMQERQARLLREQAAAVNMNAKSDTHEDERDDQNQSAITNLINVVVLKVKRLLGAVRSKVPSVATWLTLLVIVQRAHLGLFYLYGTFPELSFRLANLRYIFTREPRVNRPSYTILGMLIFLQLALQSAGFARTKLKERRGMEDSNSEELGGVSLIPSCSDDEGVSDGNGGAAGGVAHKCGICLEVMGAPSCPPCGHLYCYECIVESLTSKAECPLCRQQATASSVLCVYYRLSS
jgi:peroxin-10